jgi:hypothetical protein
MAYITSMEQMGIDKGFKLGIKTGIETGIQQGEATILKHLLESKFSKVPKRYLELIEEAKTDALLRWANRLLSAKSVEEVFEEQALA